MIVALGGGEDHNERMERDTHLVNVWLNNNQGLMLAMIGILASYKGEQAEMRIAGMVEQAIQQNIITDKINLWLVDWSEIIRLNNELDND